MNATTIKKQLTRSFKAMGLIVCSVLLWGSCKDMTELNINPNGVGEEAVNPNLIMPTVLSEAARIYLDLGYQVTAGIMQHTQKDAWFSDHNDYDWTGSQSWNAYYDVLRNNELLYKRAQEEGMEFHQGVSLVMKSFMFGAITDLWGDAPYTYALKGELGGNENLLPQFDEQETIYRGIIADLEQASSLLSKSASEYEGIVADVDVYYQGSPDSWRRFANSLLLRYYLRVSEKLPDFSKEGIERIANNPAQYPLILTSSADATMSFPGRTAADSWPDNTVIDDTGGSNFRRRKMCATLVDRLQELADPRLAIWAAKVEIPLVVSDEFPAGTDEIVDGKRHVSPDVVGNAVVDTDPEYVGLPPSFSALPSAYNLNPTPGQTSFNPHVSFVNDIYTATSGPLLKARLLSAAEVNFILAEAALKGWNVGSASTYYENGVKASLEAWTVGGQYADYITHDDVAYAGTVAQVIEQKWVASWTATAEAWFDYRRTGYPALIAGPAALRSVLPVRFYYMQDELNINRANAEQALQRLEKTAYSQADNENSAWSKPWLLQGTGKPW
ncbi:SusD/RagB family nutrient-binding outer membrane lipoprotein [Parapedobacter koreensis]|uniref:Starch-binding associating with outer membrane n=1 Tax=Parapedobacter koreensis TaxID=332977 RepID=A0A1H7FR26_9SPHI|nr:SusD/RagB family nutrient-binding outer membrane lipoprotein [Parapedobacter koreensis]SEK28409.1 Starch-binding associating with outer membrane [Parapedobacter koreensis]